MLDVAIQVMQVVVVGFLVVGSMLSLLSDSVGADFETNFRGIFVRR